jgi:hypothetical protein
LTFRVFSMPASINSISAYTYTRQHTPYLAARLLIPCLVVLVVAVIGGCVPSKTPLPFFFDPYFAAMEEGDFTGFVRAAEKAGYDLEFRHIPESGLTAGFYAALDSSPEAVIALTPLFSSEAVSALEKYPSKTFVIVDEVPELSPSARLRIVRFSRDSALRDAGIFCAKVLSAAGGFTKSAGEASAAEPFAAVLSGTATRTISSETSKNAVPANESRLFTEGFATVLSSNRLAAYVLTTETSEPSFMTAPMIAEAASSEPPIPRPRVAAVLMGPDSTQVAARLTERGISVVTEYGSGRADYDTRLLATIEGDRFEAFSLELTAVREGNPSPAPLSAEFVPTEAGKKAIP